MLSNMFRIAFLFAIPAVTFGCSCLDDSITLPASLRRATAVFRGLVLQKLNDSGDLSHYVVSVTRVFKGCNFKTSEQVLVSAGSEGSLCQVPLAVNASYVLSSYRTKFNEGALGQLGPNSRVWHAVEINSCDYNKRWRQVSAADLKTYDNSMCVARCTMGFDCLSTHYCDSGVCAPTDAACPVELSTCSVSPCSQVSGCPSTKRQKCSNNLCGGCNAVLLDVNNTQVCKFNF